MESVRSRPPIPCPPNLIPPLELVGHIKELRALLDELFQITGAEELWAVRTVTHHLDLALANPGTLAAAQNHLLDEALEAIREALEASFGGLLPARSPDEVSRRQRRLENLYPQLDGIADRFCCHLETWHRHAVSSR
ncbi:MAG: hypothetical protein J2P45_03275 [Candidatus Dormibacteraeota bacterium]|nr:hypothetical protein [Candidatus Dormibacteraeota bacterium]